MSLKHTNAMFWRLPWVIRQHYRPSDIRKIHIAHTERVVLFLTDGGKHIWFRDSERQYQWVRWERKKS